MEKSKLFYVLCFVFLTVALIAWFVTNSIIIGSGFAAAALCFLGAALGFQSENKK